MIRFIDIENGNVFNGDKPYVFWMDKEQSVNMIYIKKICVLSDTPTIDLSIEDNPIFHFVDMQNLDQYADVEINEFTYKNMADLYTNNYTSTGIQYEQYYLHMIYIAAQSDAVGEIHQDFSIDDDTFEIAADFYAENENLPINLSNLGVELPSPIQNAIYDENVHEENKDDILLNRKYKELLLEYWDTIANRGSYKSLLNSLDWFEYGDAVVLQEIWKHHEWGMDRLNREELNLIMSDKIRNTLSNFAKTTYLGIYAALQKFIDVDGVVQYDKLATIDDSDDSEDYEGLLGEMTPKLQEKFFKWSVEEMSLKMYLLGSFYESYFMPIHLDLLHSTIESLVFTNTIKCLNDSRMERRDFLYDTQAIQCNIKDGDVFQLQDVEVQAGSMLKRHRDDSDDSEDYETEMVNTYEGLEGNVNSFVTFTSKVANSTIGLARLSTNQSLEYSLDRTNWTNMTVGLTIPLANIGDSVYIRGILTGGNSQSNYTQFTMTGKIVADGDCAYIWNYQKPNTPLKSWCGFRMFLSCSALVVAPKLSSMTLAGACYREMFWGCGITETPDLPALELKDICYWAMFCYCGNLTTIKPLPATKMAPSCYANMFQLCASLVETPDLPATELANGCYYEMFAECRSLKKVTNLPALVLVPDCYRLMFYHSGAVNYVRCLATDISAAGCTSGWLSGVSAVGTLVKNPLMEDWTAGGRIPSGWTIENATQSYNIQNDTDDVQQDEYDDCLIFGIEDEYNHTMQLENELEDGQVVNNRLKTFMINNYSGQGVIIPFHCEISAESGDFINSETIYIADEEGIRVLNKHHLYHEKDGLFVLDFKLLLTKTGNQDVTLYFSTAGGRSYIKVLHLTVLGDTVCGLKIYRVKSSDMVCSNENGTSINSVDYSLDHLHSYDDEFKNKYLRPYNDYFFSHTRYNTMEGQTEPLHTYQTFIVGNVSGTNEGIKLNHVLIFDASFFSEGLQHNIDIVNTYTIDDPANGQVNLFNIGKRSTVFGKEYYTLVSKFFVGDQNDIIIDTLRSALNGYIVRYSKGFFYQHHYLEEIGVGKNEQTGHYEYGLSIDDYTITDKDTVCVVPSLSYSNIKLDKTEWIFKNTSTVDKQEFRYQSIKEPFVGNTVKAQLPKGYYDIIFKYKIGDVWNEVRLDSAFRKV